MLQSARRCVCLGRRGTEVRGIGIRSFSSSGGESTATNSDDELFLAKNVEGISQIELARMKVTYELLQEHVKAVEQNLPPPDPQRNPLIDSRSFEVRKLPKVPAEVLKALRRELPAKTAASVRPVATHSLWESNQSQQSGEKSLGLADRYINEWASVDKQTMNHRQFSKMQRQAMHGLGADITPGPSPSAPGIRTRLKCVLSDRKGRVKVDFRSVAKISSFVSEGGKILPRRKSALSAKAQRKVSRAVKSARHMALIAPDPMPGPTMDDFRALAEILEQQDNPSAHPNKA